jgi:hypothetical protein
MTDCAEPRQIVPLVKLPPSEWRLHDLSSLDHVSISVYARMVDGVPVRHWQRWSIFDFPNDLFGIVDLENAGLLRKYLSAIEQAKFLAAPVPRGDALRTGERRETRPEYHGVTLAIVTLGRKALNLFQRMLLLRAVSPSPQKRAR